MGVMLVFFTRFTDRVHIRILLMCIIYESILACIYLGTSFKGPLRVTSVERRILPWILEARKLSECYRLAVSASLLAVGASLLADISRGNQTLLSQSLVNADDWIKQVSCMCGCFSPFGPNHRSYMQG